MSAIIPLPVPLLQRLRNQLTPAPTVPTPTAIIDLCLYQRRRQSLTAALCEPSFDDEFEYSEVGAHAFTQLARQNIFENYVGPAPLYANETIALAPVMRNPQKPSLYLVR